MAEIDKENIFSFAHLIFLESSIVKSHCSWFIDKLNVFQIGDLSCSQDWFPFFLCEIGRHCNHDELFIKVIELDNFWQFSKVASQNLLRRQILLFAIVVDFEFEFLAIK